MFRESMYFYIGGLVGWIIVSVLCFLWIFDWLDVVFGSDEEDEF